LPLSKRRSLYFPAKHVLRAPLIRLRAAKIIPAIPLASAETRARVSNGLSAAVVAAAIAVDVPIAAAVTAVVHDSNAVAQVVRAMTIAITAAVMLVRRAVLSSFPKC
jgi:hypothetical protein